MRSWELIALAITVAGCSNPVGEVYDVDGDGVVVADRYGPAADRAIEYLATTELELGLDVVAALQIYGELKGHARALEVAELRRATLDASELERYGALLDVDKGPFPAGSLEGLVPSATPPDPGDDLMDDRVGRCLDEALVCEVSPSCVEYVELDDRWGYVLTHQAVTLLFARWMGCPLMVDADARRGTFAINLARAMENDATPSDLAYERLAMLGHLGFADAIDPAWLDALVDAQGEDGCFPIGPDQPCHPHPTGVALWALAHAP